MGAELPCEGEAVGAGSCREGTVRCEGARAPSLRARKAAGRRMVREGSAEKEGAERRRLRGPELRCEETRPQAAPASVSASSRAEALKPRSSAEPVPAGTARKGPRPSEGIFLGGGEAMRRKPGDGNASTAPGPCAPRRGGAAPGLRRGCRHISVP